MTCLAGHLLLALPGLEDPNFHHSVTLMIEHTEESAFGLILNRPTTTTLAEAWAHVADTPCNRHALLHVGGPCKGPLMVLHDDPEASDRSVQEGIHFSVGESNVERLVADPPPHTRFFLGYSGWGPGQLENEIRQGAWLATPATPELVFESDATVWRKLIAQAFDQIKPAGWRPAIMPEDPSLN